MAAYIVAAKRTPFGTFGGKLKDFSATALGVLATKAALSQLPKGVPIDSVIFGNVLQTSTDACYLARHIALKSGLPEHTPAITINRLCGSGFQSVVSAAYEIMAGDSDVVVAGGAENMSLAPFAARGIRFGVRFGTDPILEDTLFHALIDSHPKPTPMAITAENLAAKYHITRADCEKYALQSQQRYAKAFQNGLFKHEMVPVEVKTKKGVQLLENDEHPRPETSLDALSKLKGAFKKDGTVTAGTASGINDGAGALIVASEKAVKKYNLKPLARVVSWHSEGVNPAIMGIGPVPAIKKALKKAHLKLEDMASIEVNEAFAAQYLAVEKELGLDRNITNVNGGAIAMGHPLAASGSRILAHLVYQLPRLSGRYVCGSACIGGGQGIAVILEKC